MKALTTTLAGRRATVNFPHVVPAEIDGQGAVERAELRMQLIPLLAKDPEATDTTLDSSQWRRR